jgi:hypothetical protein
VQPHTVSLIKSATPHGVFNKERIRRDQCRPIWIIDARFGLLSCDLSANLRESKHRVFYSLYSYFVFPRVVRSVFCLLSFPFGFPYLYFCTFEAKKEVKQSQSSSSLPLSATCNGRWQFLAEAIW